jgi:hypothetical protein
MAFQNKNWCRIVRSKHQAEYEQDLFAGDGFTDNSVPLSMIWV